MLPTLVLGTAWWGVSIGLCMMVQDGFPHGRDGGMGRHKHFMIPIDDDEYESSTCEPLDSFATTLGYRGTWDRKFSEAPYSTRSTRTPFIPQKKGKRGKGKKERRPPA